MNDKTKPNEELKQKVEALEMTVKKLEVGIYGRMQELENNLYVKKDVLSFKEACMYLGISKSMLYKLTSGMKIAYYKGKESKLNYFKKEDLDNWASNERISTIEEIADSYDRRNGVSPIYSKQDGRFHK